MSLLRRLTTALAVACCTRAAVAQTPPTLPQRPLLSAPAPGPQQRMQAGQGAQSAPPAVAEPGSELRVMLLTVGAGSAVWERFGHNAIWISDPRRGIDVAYNWGMFDFNQPRFLQRFLTGDTRYWMEGFDANALVEHYAREENRSVWAQELNLTPAQRLALLQYIEWNAREENKFYRYDYYLDNCSTRVRDALDRALGGAIRRATATRLTGTTYRSHTRRLTDGDPAVYTGIQLALGRPADRELTAWEESFLPVRLMRHLRGVRVTMPDGSSAPLVLQERQLYAATRAPEPERPTSHLLAYLLGGLALGATLAVLGRASAAGRRGADAGFGVVAGVWTLVAGLAGTAVLLAGTVTRHVFMGRNLNLGAFSPLVLIALVLVVPAVGSRLRATRARWAGRAERVAALLLALSVVGWLVALGVGQKSGEIFALALPAHTGLWWGLRRMSRA
ncbi:protein of unknown function DUF4105 [Gemmatirosa kalamazoonensis]|uniref:Lnb N-terminal periplasmic domain-containing protein n=1 Tax=Gemmatirosa kalamazoonensis TaxID=861299 RepID=W0RM02_9BACT|nr:DUF4105 domain-containing protein [Gemmatirosa kalamazoonensis]AHG90468.1 protein of unknown function DUF4105 [Gemmatirosa kalamazoonensis]